MPLDPVHAHVVSTAAGLPESRTTVLAGGGAVSTALRAALTEQGWTVTRAPRPPHENRFVATDPESGRSVEVEVFPDGGRLRAPVRLDVGPVLHPDDLAADKVLALWGRVEARDVVDVVALLAVYAGQRLLELARQKAGGFTDGSFVESLHGVRRIVSAR